MNRRSVLIGLGVGGLVGAHGLVFWMARGRRRELPPVLPKAGDQDVEAIAFGRRSARGQLVSVTADGTLSVRDSTNNRVLSTSGSPNQGGATSICFSGCGQWLAAIGRDDRLWVWARQNPENDRALKLGGKPVSLVAWLPHRGSYEGIIPHRGIYAIYEGLLKDRGSYAEIPVFAVSLEDGRILFFQGPDPLLQGSDSFRRAAEFENWQMGTSIDGVL